VNKRFALLAALVILGATEILIYRGYSLYYRATERTSNLEMKIDILEREQTVFPLNDLVFHALGRAIFDATVNRLGGDPAPMEAGFSRSQSNFLRSLALNPFSALAHFDYAQALQYMSALGLASPESFIEEYKRAARLSGVDKRVFLEVGKIMLTRWAVLSPEDREYASEILRTLLEGRRDPAVLDTLLALWELNIQDEEVLSVILPPDAAVYRQTAAFLGERSLARKLRLSYLSQAEALDFIKAKDEFRIGERLLRSSGSAEATPHFQEAKAAMDRIHFFQKLSEKSYFDTTEYQTLRKSVLRELALSRIDQTRKVDEADADLQAYLALEDSSTEVGHIETFLRERGLIEPVGSGTVTDFNRYALGLWLSFKQHRYREVVQAGQSLGRSILHIPEDMKPSYARVLEIIGDAYQKLDYLYESNTTYAKAMAITGDNVPILLKMQKNYERLNDADGMKSVEARLQTRLTATEILPPGPVLAKGVAVSRTTVLREISYALVIEFGELVPDLPVYLSIKINSQAVWDDFVSGPVLRIVFVALGGENEFEITPLNGPASVRKITLNPEYAENK